MSVLKKGRIAPTPLVVPRAESIFSDPSSPLTLRSAGTPSTTASTSRRFSRKMSRSLHASATTPSTSDMRVAQYKAKLNWKESTRAINKQRAERRKRTRRAELDQEEWMTNFRARKLTQRKTRRWEHSTRSLLTPSALTPYCGAKETYSGSSGEDWWSSDGSDEDLMASAGNLYKRITNFGGGADSNDNDGRRGGVITTASSNLTRTANKRHARQLGILDSFWREEVPDTQQLAEAELLSQQQAALTLKTRKKFNVDISHLLDITCQTKQALQTEVSVSKPQQPCMGTNKRLFPQGSKYEPPLPIILNSTRESGGAVVGGAVGLLPTHHPTHLVGTSTNKQRYRFQATRMTDHENIVLRGSTTTAKQLISSKMRLLRDDVEEHKKLSQNIEKMHRQRQEAQHALCGHNYVEENKEQTDVSVTKGLQLSQLKGFLSDVQAALTLERRNQVQQHEEAQMLMKASRAFEDRVAEYKGVGEVPLVVWDHRTLLIWTVVVKLTTAATMFDVLWEEVIRERAARVLQTVLFTKWLEKREAKLHLAWNILSKAWLFIVVNLRVRIKCTNLRIVKSALKNIQNSNFLMRNLRLFMQKVKFLQRSIRSFIFKRTIQMDLLVKQWDNFERDRCIILREQEMQELRAGIAEAKKILDKKHFVDAPRTAKQKQQLRHYILKCIDDQTSVKGLGVPKSTIQQIVDGKENALTHMWKQSLSLPKSKEGLTITRNEAKKLKTKQDIARALEPVAGMALLDADLLDDKELRKLAEELTYFTRYKLFITPMDLKQQMVKPAFDRRLKNYCLAQRTYDEKEEDMRDMFVYNHMKSDYVLSKVSNAEDMKERETIIHEERAAAAESFKVVEHLGPRPYFGLYFSNAELVQLAEQGIAQTEERRRNHFTTILNNTDAQLDAMDGETKNREQTRLNALSRTKSLYTLQKKAAHFTDQVKEPSSA